MAINEIHLRDKVERMDIKLLKPYKNNSKKHDPEQILMIKNAIKKFGFTTPILIDKNNIVIAGHGRLIAAQELKMSYLPIIRINDLSDKEIKALRISDNKLNESEWDLDMLKEEFHELEDTDVFDLTGFEPEEITDIWDKSVPQKSVQAENVEKIGSLLLTCPKCKHKFKKGTPIPEQKEILK